MAAYHRRAGEAAAPPLEIALGRNVSEERDNELPQFFFFLVLAGSAVGLLHGVRSRAGRRVWGVN